MARINIVIYNMYFTVNIEDYKLASVVRPMLEQLTTYSYEYSKTTKKVIRIPDKLYYSYNKIDNIYRFSVNLVRDFMLLLGSQNVVRSDLSITYDRNYEIEPLGLEFNPALISKDYQDKYLDRLLNKESKNISLVDLDTGKGKTFIAMQALVNLNMRLAIVVKPTYIDKWIGDVKFYTNIKDDEIFLIQGSESIIELVNKEVITYKVIIISLRTVYNFIDNFESGTNRIPIEPYEFTRKHKIGALLSDEAHQEFYSIFKMMLYFDVNRFIALSATLDTRNASIKRMYQILFPDANRISNIAEFDPYIVVREVFYSISDIRRLIFKGPKGYNHNLFEQSILRNSLFLNAYFEMITDDIKTFYIRNRRKDKKDKCLIFCASINFCSIFTNYLKKMFPTLDVRRYVEDDPYENIMESDICVSTVLSSGTALDIPNLIDVFQTVSIGSLQSNRQSMGRLREIPGVETRFHYYYSRDIPNQYKLHHERKSVLLNKAKKWIEHKYPVTIRTR